MKGQFFIIGALFVCTILYFGIGPTLDVAGPESQDMGRLALNLQKEFPHALNIGINGSAPLETLRNFTFFSAASLEEGRIGLTCYWLIFRDAAGKVNVSAGNFMGEPLIFHVNVSGVSMGIYADEGEINSSAFSVPGYSYDASVTVDGERSGFTLLTNKTYIYSELTLTRSGNVVRKEILA
jgi:hypothetical protein